ncbi:hypothetical protein [Microtetraspora malaysiensis]|uniref:Uncharacterized protein n=1 Tax=Microtetraspora malaysiensis TaxID=161358 RepID=A0ABW6SN22_9ACTN
MAKIEIEIKLPLADWTTPKYRILVERYADHVAIKQRGTWAGFADAIDDEIPERATTVSFSGGYFLVPREHLRGNVARLGENAHRVIIREVRAEEGQ